VDGIIVEFDGEGYSPEVGADVARLTASVPGFEVVAVAEGAASVASEDPFGNVPVFPASGSLIHPFESETVSAPVRGRGKR
jgi:hypothetical protein